MRILKDGYFLVKPGELSERRRKDKPKKRKGIMYKDMTPEQRRKVDELRRKAAEVNQDVRHFQGAEIRSC